MTDDQDRQHAELLAVYQMSTDDLERAKQWGWQITYQTVLAHLGLVALRKAYTAGGLIDVVFIVGILGLTAVAYNYISSTQRSITKFRSRITRCQSQVSAQTRDLLGTPDEKRPWPLASVVTVAGVLAVVLVVVG